VIVQNTGRIISGKSSFVPGILIKVTAVALRLLSKQAESPEGDAA